MGVDELIAEAVQLTEEKQAIEAELGARMDQVLHRRRWVYWQAHREGLSAMAISRQVTAGLADRGIGETRGLGVSHDSVRRAVDGPEPVC